MIRQTLNLIGLAMVALLLLLCVLPSPAHAANIVKKPLIESTAPARAPWVSLFGPRSTDPFPPYCYQDPEFGWVCVK